MLLRRAARRRRRRMWRRVATAAAVVALAAGAAVRASRAVPAGAASGGGVLAGDGPRQQPGLRGRGHRPVPGPAVGRADLVQVSRIPAGTRCELGVVTAAGSTPRRRAGPCPATARRVVPASAPFPEDGVRHFMIMSAGRTLVSVRAR